MLDFAPLSTDTRTILLLCGRFGARRPGIRPLTQGEYHDLEHALEARQLTPSNLFDLGPADIWPSGANGISARRLGDLLARADELVQALIAWAEAGIWVLSERDPEYPQRLRRRLTSARPPLIFGAGPKEPLDGGGICVVGSRDSPKPALSFAETLGRRCGDEGLTIITSDMRGIDRKTFTAALDAGGRVICVLSDSLEKTVAQPRHRRALADGRLTLVTPFPPDARFSVANAMRANRYQYALSDTAVVVETRRQGGIWSGADENRKEGWVPAFVRAGKEMSPGNLALLHLGSHPITGEEVEAADSLADFFFSHTLLRRKTGKATEAGVNTGVNTGINRREIGLFNKMAATVDFPALDLYSVFLAEFQMLAQHRPLREKEIMSHFCIQRGQARIWLRRAVGEGKAKRLEGPVRYSVDGA